MPARQDTMALRAEIAGWKALGMIPALMAKLLVYQYGVPLADASSLIATTEAEPRGRRLATNLVYDDPEEGAS